MFLDPQVCYFWEGAWPARQVEPLRRIYETELVYLSQGAFDLQVNDHVHSLRPGAVALIPPGIWHESRVTTPPVVRHCVHFTWQPGPARPTGLLQSFLGQSFNEALVSPVPKPLANRLPLVMTLKPGDTARRILELALDGLRRNEAMGQWLLWPVLSALLAPTTAAPAKRSGRRPEVAQAAMKVRDYIDIHYQEPHGYKVYTKVAGLKASHLCQAFKRLFGRTPNDYLNDLRLSQAYRILQSDQMGMAQTARLVGIRDPNYFARIFRRRFGVTPSDVSRGQAPR